MKNILRSGLLFLLQKLKMRYNLYRNIDGEWRHFTWKEFKDIRHKNDILTNVMFEDEIKNYRVVEVVAPISRTSDPILYVEEDNSTQSPFINEQPKSIFRFFRRLFK